jgi:hypothetical protein
MLTKEYILEKIEKHCTLNESLCEGTFYDLVVSPLEDAQCFNDWTWDTGVSKGVLIFGELDYVIKIPFYCEWFEGDGGYYDEDDNWVDGDPGEPSGYAFQGVEVEGYCHQNEWDYCETEELRYLVAEKNDMEEHFAKTWCIGTVSDWPIYAQVKCCMYSSADSHSTRSKKVYTNKDRESAKSIKDATHFWVEDEWLIDFLHYWGQERLMAFIEFCDKWFIDDLHQGNLGYVCGVPCLVDYSSFNN